MLDIFAIREKPPKIARPQKKSKIMELVRWGIWNTS